MKKVSLVMLFAVLVGYDIYAVIVLATKSFGEHPNPGYWVGFTLAVVMQSVVIGLTVRLGRSLRNDQGRRV